MGSWRHRRGHYGMGEHHRDFIALAPGFQGIEILRKAKEGRQGARFRPEGNRCERGGFLEKEVMLYGAF